MTIQDLGNLGELIEALATVATIGYLAMQVRQNTRALRSSTFQNIGQQMAHDVEPLATSPDLAALLVQGMADLQSLSPSSSAASSDRC